MATLAWRRARARAQVPVLGNKIQINSHSDAVIISVSTSAGTVRALCRRRTAPEAELLSVGFSEALCVTALFVATVAPTGLSPLGGAHGGREARRDRARP